MAPPEPAFKPCCSVSWSSVSEDPYAPSNRRKESELTPALLTCPVVGLTRSMMSALPTMVKSTAFVPPTTGSPLAPFVVLFTLFKSKVVLGYRLMVNAPPVLSE